MFLSVERRVQLTLESGTESSNPNVGHFIHVWHTIHENFPHYVELATIANTTFFGQLRVSETENQRGTVDMRDQVLPEVAAQGKDTSGYQLFDL